MLLLSMPKSCIHCLSFLIALTDYKKFSNWLIDLIIHINCMRGSRGGWGWGVRTPLGFIFIFVHFHSYTSNRINLQNNNQITSIQVCVMGFFLLKVGPSWKKFLDPRLNCMHSAFRVLTYKMRSPILWSIILIKLMPIRNQFNVISIKN